MTTLPDVVPAPRGQHVHLIVLDPTHTYALVRAKAALWILPAVSVPAYHLEAERPLDVAVRHLAELGIVALPIHEAVLTDRLDVPAGLEHSWQHYAAFEACPGAARASNLRWTPVEALLASASGGTLNPANVPALRRCLTRMQARDAPFDSVGRVAEIDAWLRERLALTGAQVTGLPVPRRMARWEMVLEVPTTIGLLRFKAGAGQTPRGVMLMQELRLMVPEHVPAMIATDPARGWWLTGTREVPPDNPAPTRRRRERAGATRDPGVRQERGGRPPRRAAGTAGVAVATVATGATGATGAGGAGEVGTVEGFGTEDAWLQAVAGLATLQRRVLQSKDALDLIKTKPFGQVQLDRVAQRLRDVLARGTFQAPWTAEWTEERLLGLVGLLRASVYRLLSHDLPWTWTPATFRLRDLEFVNLRTTNGIDRLGASFGDGEDAYYAPPTLALAGFLTDLRERTDTPEPVLARLQERYIEAWTGVVEPEVLRRAIADTVIPGRLFDFWTRLERLLRGDRMPATEDLGTGAAQPQLVERAHLLALRLPSRLLSSGLLPTRPASLSDDRLSAWRQPDWGRGNTS